jgi:hypothetical protein
MTPLNNAQLSAENSGLSSDRYPEHILDDDGKCWCEPSVETRNGNRLIIHNSIYEIQLKYLQTRAYPKLPTSKYSGKIDHNDR